MNFIVSQCAVLELNTKVLFTLSVAITAPSQISLSMHQLPKCQRWLGSRISDNTWTNLPHFADKETEAWSGMVISSRSHSELLAELGFKPGQKASECS